ncbi:hypothetical protein ZIOFF_069226 [Zingiber officinale]|uniref:Serine/threonine-protein kinase PRP4 homolog n=1 Tax=Zingiber officinale TaxID=94328 RepID=A0A8J5C3U8_ZINOF|nr:hypothetical protein ZIOFF_069226 [Zingiber officinale]
MIEVSSQKIEDFNQISEDLNESIEYLIQRTEELETNKGPANATAAQEIHGKLEDVDKEPKILRNTDIPKVNFNAVIVAAAAVVAAAVSWVVMSQQSRRQGHGSGEDARDSSPAPQVVAGSSVEPMVVDDEREEGEILEEDEESPEVNGGKFDGFKLAGSSDAESGEINSAGLDGDTNLLYYRNLPMLLWLQILHVPKDTSCTQNMKALDHNQVVHGNDFSSRSDRDHLERAMSDEGTLSLKFETVSFSDEEKKIAFQTNAKKRQRKSSENDVHDSKVHVSSRSPVSREHSHLINHRKEDDLEKRNSDSDSGMLDSSDYYVDSRDVYGRQSDRSRSISAKRLMDKHLEIGRSPFSESFHDDRLHQDRSKSCDHTERLSSEKVSRPLANGDDPVDSGGSRDDFGRYNRLDNAIAINRASNNELPYERENSISGIQDDRHGNWDKEKERDRNSRGARDRDNVDLDKRTHRERERIDSHNRHDREHRHGSRARDNVRERSRGSARDKDNVEFKKEVRSERESSSYSRYDRREDNHDVRDKDRNRERYSSSKSERVRDSHSDLKKERRDSRQERNIVDDHRDKNRAWDREVNVQNVRNHGQIEKDRGANRDKHIESRHSRHDESQHHKDKSRSKEEGFHTDHPKEDKQKSIREEEEDDYQERITQQLAKQDEEDVDKIKEESRKRRQAILEKYRQRQLQQVESSSDGNVNANDKATLDKEKQQGPQATVLVDKPNGHELESANDFGDASDVDTSFTVKKSPVQIVNLVDKASNTAGELGEGTPKSERSTDMFSDDIFGESPAGVSKMVTRQSALVKDEGPQIDQSCLYDNWDDAEGYYSYRFGEVLDGRYEVIAAHGKGVFSTVVRVKDLKARKSDPEVAIKIIRNNETMYKAGQDELVILKKLAGADPEDKRHCVRFISSFKYRNHLCLVFESLHMNLREVLKKFGRNIGLKLTAVRAYAKQLFIALKHLRNCGVLHCDIKPDNMLVNEAKNVLKLCDFGNAMFAGKNEITPYLVSRFYRAPEIILGLPYDHPMDMWSVGCCLYELYTGKVLFPGPSNNDMLRLHMELKGPFPKKMLRKGAFTDQHFDQDLNFHATEEDPVTKKPIKRLLFNIKPKDICALISSFPGEDPKLLSSFKDLLDRIFVLDPEKRMTVSQALSHPFITGK